ncbi:hypothetical protein Micbo1qcDRAFT_20262 [Microdochium bolleyi]|uniref:Uncharacterized protein n=1 Tax=Microdochium bolleyi TaxID=196109 RepID=A0A136ISV5_9PEZI|nr:hypothetical protein Micbo1qcDRAFT_20262 [Microdochium bolleyi]
MKSFDPLSRDRHAQIKHVHGKTALAYRPRSPLAFDKHDLTYIYTIPSKSAAMAAVSTTGPAHAATIMATPSKSSADTVGPAPSTKLSPAITTITISEISNSHDGFPLQSPDYSPSYSNNTTVNAHAAADHQPAYKHPHLVSSTSSSSRQTPGAEDDGGNESGSMVVQMAVDELRAMGETLRRATKQQQRMIEETMSQWRSVQQEQQQQHHQQQQNQQRVTPPATASQ